MKILLLNIILQKVQKLVTRKRFSGENWTAKLDLYFKKYGVGLRFVLVANTVLESIGVLGRNIDSRKIWHFWFPISGKFRHFSPRLPRV